jgi:hypothetical protein
MKAMQIAGDTTRSKSIALPQIQDFGDNRARCGTRGVKGRAGPIAQAGLTVTLVPGVPFVEGLARKTIMPAGLGNASGEFVGLPDKLQTPGNHSVLFILYHGALSCQEKSQNVTLVLGLHK